MVSEINTSPNEVSNLGCGLKSTQKHICNAFQDFSFERVKLVHLKSQRKLTKSHCFVFQRWRKVKGQKRWSRTEDKGLMKSFTAPSSISCQSLISQRAKNGSDVHRYESLDTSLLCQTLSFQHTHIIDRKSLQYVLYTNISF